MIDLRRVQCIDFQTDALFGAVASLLAALLDAVLLRGLDFRDEIPLVVAYILFGALIGCMVGFVTRDAFRKKLIVIGIPPIRTFSD